MGKLILRWWPVILLGLAFSTWAATELIDDRIDLKLGVLVERLHNIEKVLVQTNQRLEHIEEAVRK